MEDKNKKITIRVTEENYAKIKENAENAGLPSYQSIYQIRINQTLYGAGTDLSGETFTIRIPGTEEYLRLYSDDSRIFNDGQTISSYIYEDAEYQIENADGQVLRRATGSSVKDKFKSREVDRNKNKNLQENNTWKRA